MSLTFIHNPLFGMQHVDKQLHRQLHRDSSFVTLLLCVFSWPFLFLHRCLQLIFVFHSLRCCLFLFFDKQPTCWDGEAFRHAGMCQSSLPKWSLFYLILCFSRYFFPFIFPSLFLSFFLHVLVYSPPPFHSDGCICVKRCISTQIYLASSDRCGAWVMQAITTPLAPLILSLLWAKSHICQPPGKWWGVSTMNTQRWYIELIHI